MIQNQTISKANELNDLFSFVSQKVLMLVEEVVSIWIH